jgi:hypothetical protein
MTEEDRAYYRGRMAAEELAARGATHPLAADCHRRLAAKYASLVAATETEIRRQASSWQPAAQKRRMKAVT